MMSIQTNVALAPDQSWVTVGSHATVTSSLASIIAVATLRPQKPGAVEFRLRKNVTPTGTPKSFAVGPFFAVNARDVSFLDQVASLTADTVELQARNMGTDPVTLAEVRFMLLP